MTDTTNIDRIMRGLDEVSEIVETTRCPALVYAPVGTDPKASGHVKD